MQTPKTNSDMDDARYEVILPKEGAMFDIGQSDALSSLRSAWGIEVGMIHLDSGHYIKK